MSISLFIYSPCGNSADVSDRTTPNSNAQRNPSTSNPGTITAVSRTSPAFITKVNNPRDRIFIGSVRKTSIGLRNAFTTPKITAVTRAAKKLSTITPGRIYATAKMTMLDTSQVIKASVSVFSFIFHNFIRRND